MKEGLAGTAIRGILQDSKGDLWLATDGGVSRYQSGKFTNYTTANGLTENQVWSIFQDSDDTIWVDTMGGVCRFDGKAFVPFAIPKAQVEKPADGFGPQVVWSMFEDPDGNMWFGTDGEGAWKFDGTSFTSYTARNELAGNTVRAITGDRHGRIWFGTRLGGMSRFDGKKFTNFTQADGLANDEVYEILEARDGALWLSTRGKGVCRYDGSSFTNFGIERGLTLPHVQSIFEDKNGLIWLGCSGGLFHYDGKTFVNVGKEGPWPNVSKVTDEFSVSIRPLLEKYCVECHAPGEMEGLDFLAAMTDADVTQHKYLFADVAEQMEIRTMPPRDFAQPTEAERKLVTDWIRKQVNLKPEDTDRISTYVVEVFQDKQGNLWMGTMQDGAARYDGKTLTYFSTKDGLPSNTVTSFAEDKDGNLWAGTHSGVCKFDGKTFQRLGSAVGLPDVRGSGPRAWSSAQTDRKGNVWVRIGNTLFRSNGASFVPFALPIQRDKISSYAIDAGSASFDLEDRQGNLWFGTDGAGAFRYDGKAFTQFTTADGLCSNNVTSIHEDKNGMIWFACIQSFQPKMTGDGGVCRFDGKTFNKFPKTKGLSENDIYTIYETRSGDIWIGATGVGAYRYDGQEFTLFNETNREHWTRNFGVQDILEDRNGTLWFGFSGGLFRFDGTSFFNVTKKGPWKDLVSTMADTAAGEQVDGSSWIHDDARQAMVALAESDLDKATKIMRKLKSEQPQDQTVQEETINRIGYHLIFDRKLELATEVLKLNTLLYPSEFNTFDSLGEAYWRQGDESLAIENYKKSLKLNPENSTAKVAIRQILARQRYEKALVAPKEWLEEVLIVPPDFAPTMSLTGLEHLRLPPDFRDPDSDWFISYLFAIELTERIEINERMIGEQLLLYFQGLADGARDKKGKEINTNAFSIVPKNNDGARVANEFVYSLKWQEPFAGGNFLTQNLRVKLIEGKNQHGVVFVCGSPQPFGSHVWKKLLEIRGQFSEGDVPKQQR